MNNFDKIKKQIGEGDVKGALENFQNLLIISENLNKDTEILRLIDLLR
jgi:hypothetical protein